MVTVKDTRRTELEQRYGISGVAGAPKTLREVRFKADYSDTVELTYDVAAKHLELPDVEGDRKLRQDWVEDYLRRVDRGTFLWGNVELVTILCREDNITYRGNGQHCCWVRLFVAKDNPKWGPKVRRTHYVVKTIEEMRELYTIFDRQHVRTPQQVINARLFNSDEFTGVARRKIASLVAGYRQWRWASWDEKKKVGTVDTACDQIQSKHPELARKVADILGEKPDDNKHLWRAATIGAMFATYEKNSVASVDFWNAVKVGAGLQQNDPQWRLREFLKDAVVSVHSKSKARPVDTEDMLRACINCWNNWRRGDQMPQSVRIQFKTRPVAHG
jgi:hypothetical protein